MNRKFALMIVTSMVATASMFPAFADGAAKGSGDQTVTTATVKSPEPPRDASLIGSRPSTGVQSVRPPKKEHKE